MSPLPTLHHHDIMTIVGCSSYTYVCYNMSRNVGALKIVYLHCSRQQCVVAKWSGCSITVRVRVRARAREWIFFFCVINPQ